MDTLLEAITRAERPVILAGAGVIHADASDELIQFAETMKLPVTTTLLGLGGFPSSHPLWVGMPGMHGSYAANNAIQKADLLISIGARFDDRLTMSLSGFAPHAEIAHIDIDKAEIGKNVPTKFPVIGDIKNMLSYALPHTHAAQSAEWIQTINTWKDSQPLRYIDSDDVLKPQWVIELLHRTTGGNAIITTDVGQHQFWTAQYYQFNRPRSLITSGGMGTMGFGLPSAIGAQIGAPDTLVISINGDGGIQMSSHELAVCAIHQLPVKVIIINNERLGMVRQLQETAFNQRYSHVDLSGSPDFVKLAEAYGVKGLRASTKAEAEHVWQEALATDGPVLIEFVVPSSENVYPVVPNGKTLDEMMMGDDA
jgi:acetolactate synthase-1/2/3 large subunit